MAVYPRLRSHDYRCPGAYFVTMGTWRRTRLFGTVRGGIVNLSPEGLAVAEAWLAIPAHFPQVRLDTFVVMPDHFHGIFCLGPSRHTVGQIVGLFKGAATRAITELWGGRWAPIWQRGFHDWIIRDDRAWCSISRYIDANPRNWKG